MSSLSHFFCIICLTVQWSGGNIPEKKNSMFCNSKYLFDIHVFGSNLDKKGTHHVKMSLPCTLVRIRVDYHESLNVIHGIISQTC